ncbi:MAG: hypothetical protein KY475_10235 [Planctomycetes bacterium]|nr:hypothetical protein [Planctomycetota bacterium]
MVSVGKGMPVCGSHGGRKGSSNHPANKAQLLSYMKCLDIRLGLTINFHVLKLTDGVSRLILPGANVE